MHGKTDSISGVFYTVLRYLNRASSKQTFSTNVGTGQTSGAHPRSIPVPSACTCICSGSAVLWAWLRCESPKNARRSMPMMRLIMRQPTPHTPCNSLERNKPLTKAFPCMLGQVRQDKFSTDDVIATGLDLKNTSAGHDCEHTLQNKQKLVATSVRLEDLAGGQALAILRIVSELPRRGYRNVSPRFALPTLWHQFQVRLDMCGRPTNSVDGTSGSLTLFCTARAPCAHRIACWNKLGAKGHSLVPRSLDAYVLPILGGGDDGGRHPITI